MRFALLPTLCLIGSTIAAPAILEQRDDTVAKYHIARMLASLKTLETTIKREPRYNDARATDDFFRSISEQQNRLTDDSRDGANEIRRGKKINDIEALGISNSLSPMENSIRAINNQFVKFKREAEFAGQKEAILRDLIRAQIEGNNFWDALVGKVSKLSGAFATNSRQRYNAILDRSIREYR
jgi:hypothetical protein